MSDFHTHLTCVDEARVFITGEREEGPDCMSPLLLSYARSAQQLLSRDEHAGITDCDFLIGTFAADLEAERLRYLVLHVARPALVDVFRNHSLPKLAAMIDDSDLVDELCGNLGYVANGREAVAFYRRHPEPFIAADHLLECVHRGSRAFEARWEHPARQQGPCPTCGRPWAGAPAVVPAISPFECRDAAHFAARCIHVLGHGPNNQWFRHDRALRAAALMSE